VEEAMISYEFVAVVIWFCFMGLMFREELLAWLWGPLLNRGAQRPEAAMANYVLTALEKDPEGWLFNNCHATYRGRITLWIANRPSCDMKLDSGMRIGDNRTRAKMRILMDQIQVAKLAVGLPRFPTKDPA
jgi:hypothetical protein